jgi:hypothetical protein
LDDPQFCSEKEIWWGVGAAIVMLKLSANVSQSYMKIIHQLKCLAMELQIFQYMQVVWYVCHDVSNGINSYQCFGEMQLPPSVFYDVQNELGTSYKL